MIKKSVFENDLIFGMQRELTNNFEKTAAMENLPKAADYVQAAMEIFEEMGLISQANQLLNVLQKIAEEDQQDAKGKPRKPKNPTKIHDTYIPKSSDQEVKNYIQHGWAFNLSDDGKADTILDVELSDDLNVVEGDFDMSEKTFEDES
jgi:hypothetical protein